MNLKQLTMSAAAWAVGLRSIHDGKRRPAGWRLLLLGGICVAGAPLAQTRDPAAVSAMPPKVAVVAQAQVVAVPPQDGRLVSLPRFSEGQIKDFLTDLVLDLELTKGYTRASADALQLPPLSARISEGATLIRKSAGATDVLRVGYVLRERGLPQLWIHGVRLAADGPQSNPDAGAAVLDPILKALLTVRQKLYSKLALSGLQSRVIDLSYIDADGAIAALRSMGFSAIAEGESLPQDTAYRGEDIALLAAPAVKPAAAPLPGVQPSVGVPAPPAPPAPPANLGSAATLGIPANLGSPATLGPALPAPGGIFGGTQSAPVAVRNNVPTSINFEQLPLIMKMPAPPAPATGLVGAPIGAAAVLANAQHALGLTITPSAASSLAPTVSARTTQLVVLFHPEHIEQYAKVQRALAEVIDKPARQVVIEGLVLEVSKQGIEELGVQWTRKSGQNTLQLGALTQLTPGSGQTSLSLVRNTLDAFDPKQFMARINALVDSNKAEVLSRPSVLTLDDRQATIRVGNDIPIATSKDTGAAAGGRVAFSFQYLPTGIQLNVRPRISADGREVSMIIDATVSATVPGQELRVLDPVTNFLLASAPTISQRRVQTYARIANNAPLIIGGLVSRDQIKQEDKVPGLGDIPLFGRLFGFEGKKDARTEVIIVLTPSIVTEEFRATKPQVPKDDDRFDQFGAELFRESYRIRAEDLIDSQHIRFNQRLLNYRAIVRQLIERNPDLAKVPPFSRFLGTSVPGEFVFVSGMMSRMLARFKKESSVNIDKLTFFEGIGGAAFKTESVGGLLKRLGDGQTHKGFFEKNPGKALTLRFNFARNLTTPHGWSNEPLADIKLVDCPDRDTWKKLLWDMNQPVAGVQQHYTIVIHDESDLRRLQLAFVLKNTILVNGNEAGTIFDNFLPGRVLAMQEIAPAWERTMEATIARYFYFGELFYPAFSDALERAIQDLDRALRQPQLVQYLSGITLP